MAASRSFIAGTNITTGANPFSFTSQSLGAAAAGRYIVVCIEARIGGGTPTLTDVTIAGITATIVKQQASGAGPRDITAIAIAAVPTGTSGTIDVTFSATMLRCSISVYRVLGIDGLAAFDTDGSTATNPTCNLDIPAGGVAFGSVIAAVNSAVSWTGLTEDYDTVMASNTTASTASDEFASTQTGLLLVGTFASGGTDPCGAFASWSPEIAADGLMPQICM